MSPLCGRCSVRHESRRMPLLSRRGKRHRSGGISRHIGQGRDSLHHIQPVSALRKNDHQRGNQRGRLQGTLFHRRHFQTDSQGSRSQTPSAYRKRSIERPAGMDHTDHGHMKSFRLYIPHCPQCGSHKIRFSGKTGALIFLIVQLFTFISIGICYVCKDCGHRWME